MAKTSYKLKHIPDSAIKAIRPNYSLKVVQQPLQARACGSTKSFAGRRSIDPPPIIKVSLHSRNKNVIDHSYNYLVMTVMAELIDQCEENLGSAASQKAFKKRKPNLEKKKDNLIFGTTSVAANIISNSEYVISSSEIQEELKAFFVFSDISVRFEGFYRLNFRLWEFPLSKDENFGSSLIYRGGIKSDVFKVYNAKFFPGLDASPNLTVKLKGLGSRIRVRKSSKKDTRDQAVRVAAVGAQMSASMPGNSEEKTGIDNLKVLSQISSAIANIPSQEIKNETNNNGSSSPSNTNNSQQFYYGTQNSGFQFNGLNSSAGSSSNNINNNNNNQFYQSYNFYQNSTFNSNGQYIDNGQPITMPNAHIIAAATQTASAAVDQQKQQERGKASENELVFVPTNNNTPDDANIDDEFKKDLIKSKEEQSSQQ